MSILIDHLENHQVRLENLERLARSLGCLPTRWTCFCAEAFRVCRCEAEHRERVVNALRYELRVQAWRDRMVLFRNP